MRAALAERPETVQLLLRRRVLAREATREELITAFDEALAAGDWKAVALRLNGFNTADIARMVKKMTVEQMRSTRAAAERELAGWPMQHVLDALDAGAASKGSHLRPLSMTIWNAYADVKYGTMQKEEVWDHVGGSVGKGFAGQNTCATRVSVAFNYGGWPIRDSDPGWIYPNKASVTHNGTAGDGKRYIVSAPYLEKFLTGKWGKPDARFKTNQQARDFEATLQPTQVAVFAGPHHAGLIKQGYQDPYVFTDPGVMPAAAWKLPV